LRENDETKGVTWTNKDIGPGYCPEVILDGFLDCEVTSRSFYLNKKVALPAVNKHKRARAKTVLNAFI